jgi:hypothetical protein
VATVASTTTDTVTARGCSDVAENIRHTFANLNHPVKSAHEPSNSAVRNVEMPPDTNMQHTS